LRNDGHGRNTKPQVNIVTVIAQAMSSPAQRSISLLLRGFIFPLAFGRIFWAVEPDRRCREGYSQQAGRLMKTISLRKVVIASHRAMT